MDSNEFMPVAYSMRQEARLCDIILFTQGQRGGMVGYPAHKIVLISASRYFKSLLDTDNLSAHHNFPTLTEDGLYSVLEVVYGGQVPADVNLDDALMAARILKVDKAIEIIEQVMMDRSRSSRVQQRHTYGHGDHMGVGAPLHPHSSVRSSPYQQPHHHRQQAKMMARSSLPSSGHHQPSPSHEQSGSSVGPGMRLYRNVHSAPSPSSSSTQQQQQQPTPQKQEYQSPGPSSEGSAPTDDQPPPADNGKSDNTPIKIEWDPEDEEESNQSNQGAGGDDPDDGGGGDGIVADPVDENMDFSHILDADTDNNFSYSDSAQAADQGQWDQDAEGSGAPQNKECDICGKVFGTVNQMMEHRATHTDLAPDALFAVAVLSCGVRVMRCAVCRYETPHRGHMTQHVLVHTRLKPFACRLCDYACRQKSSLRRHVVCRHPQDSAANQT